MVNAVRLTARSMLLRCHRIRILTTVRGLGAQVDGLK